MTAGLGENEDLAGQAGWKVTASLDPSNSVARVRLETFGKTVTGVPLFLPPANGTYKRVKPDAASAPGARRKSACRRGPGCLPGTRRQGRSCRSSGHSERPREFGEDERLENARLVAESVEEKTPVEEVPDYWQTMAEMTRTRAQLLLAASASKRDRAARDITWTIRAARSSCRSGRESPKTLTFEISVVRGPTAHTGALAGVAEFKEPDLAVFVDKDEEAFSDGKPATVRFRFRAHELVVEAENTSFYHGIRAFFDGTYYRLPE